MSVDKNNLLFPLLHCLLWPGLLGFINILVIQQLIPYQYLIILPAFIFLPGYLLLEGMKYENRKFSFFLYYSIGISLLVIFIAGLANTLISTIDPRYFQFSQTNLLFWYDFIFIACLFFYFFNNREALQRIPFSHFFHRIYSHGAQLQSRVVILGILLILCSLTGVFLNFRWNNPVVAILTVLIVCVLVWYANVSERKEGDYPFLLWCISIALLFQSSLLSQFIRGADIQREYQHIQSVLDLGSWVAGSQGYLNSMLSISVLGPQISNILSISPVDALKIIYPLIFSFLPIALFQVYASFLGKRGAFNATFLFIAFAVFYSEMLSLGRQEIAEFFLGMLLILSIDSGFKSRYKQILFVITLLAIVWSHYALSYLLIILLVMALLFRVVVFSIQKWRKKETRQPYRFATTNLVSFPTVLILIVFTFCWYLYTSQSISVLAILERVKPAISFYFSGPSGGGSASSYVSYALGQAPLPSAGMIGATVVFDLIQVFIVLGILYSLLSTKYQQKGSFTDLVPLAFASLVFLGCAVLVPLVGNSLNISRIYHILLIFLAPFCVVGVRGLVDSVFSMVKKVGYQDQERTEKIWYDRVICVMFIIFFAFQSGLVFTLSSDIPLSYSLNYQQFQYQFVFQEDIISAEWLSNHSHAHSSVLGDLDFSFIYNFENSFNPNVTLLGSDVFLKKGVGEGQYYLVRKGNEQSGIFRTSSFMITGNKNTDREIRSRLIPLNQIYSSGTSIYTH